MKAISALSSTELQSLASELSVGRIPLRCGALTLERWLDRGRAREIAAAFAELAEAGFTALQAAMLLQSLVVDRFRRQPDIGDVLQLVATCPGDDSESCRDTGAVVQAMFAGATQSVDVVGFAVYQGREVFRLLADRMQAVPQLRVRMFLNVARGQGDSSTDHEVVRQFAQRFRTQQWPENAPLPELFYDPRSLCTDGKKRASLHAKCIAVDARSVFISSANFTEAAHERNIELGLRVESAFLAGQLTGFLDHLINSNVLVRLVC